MLESCVDRGSDDRQQVSGDFPLMDVTGWASGRGGSLGAETSFTAWSQIRSMTALSRAVGFTADGHRQLFFTTRSFKTTLHMRGDALVIAPA
jgi:hypothetical protein